jgi:hypothetical protein
MAQANGFSVSNMRYVDKNRVVADFLLGIAFTCAVVGYMGSVMDLVTINGNEQTMGRAYNDK